VGAAEIAQILDVSRQRVQQLADRQGFPEPVAVLSMGKVWRTKAILRWARQHARGDAADRWEAGQL
jgi:prophage regulatory protein